jgi:orotate phosphoribosyltransferase
MIDFDPVMKYALQTICKNLEVVRRGNFKTASGKEVDVYLDMRKVILFAPGTTLVATAFWGLLEKHFRDVEAVGGMGYGGVPLVGAVLATSQKSISGFLVRKGLKEYGTQKMVEGLISPGTRCCLLEDVTTTGGSLLSAAIKTAEITGERPKMALTIVDRGEGAIEMLAEQGIQLIPLLTMAELLE